MSQNTITTDLTHPDRFVDRHIGPSVDEIHTMLTALGHHSIDDFCDAVVPASIRSENPLRLPQAVSEHQALEHLRALADKNDCYRSYIGMGYHGCITPTVIRRNVLENPGWYTSYTPYQAEISQGRLESLLNFQTMICDLTGMELANASLLDEATAAAEAMTLAYNAQRGKKKAQAIFVAHDCHPQTIDLIRTRAEPLALEVIVGDHREFLLTDNCFAILLQYPATDGGVRDYRAFIEQAHAVGALALVATDLLALTVLTPPGEFGADVVIGSSQRFGVPMMYGGPHAAFFAVNEKHKRLVPGRIIGVSKDVHGNRALRMAMQTREQHIRRDKATSNICTAQALLANMAVMYAIYHGPEGLKRIAQRVHTQTCVLADGLRGLGYAVGPTAFFDTLRVNCGERTAAEIIDIAEHHHINLRLLDSQTIGISVDETVRARDIDELLAIFNDDESSDCTCATLLKEVDSCLDTPFIRTSSYLEQDVFNSHHSETEMMRFLKRLEDKDLSLKHSMISLGSCTMKLNAATEMEPVSWPGFANMHPFAPIHQTRGYQVLFQQLEKWLAEITGFDGVSLQPNAGSQGEYAGLLAIANYHASRGQGARNVCLIPTSAHGTNPASAAMTGMKIVTVACDEKGNISVDDLLAKAEAHSDDLAAFMVTYPSTHGVFEERIVEMCDIIHKHGGQVYMDGANMNAQVGLCSPGAIGADVCHLNLHKTFAIPHGGGGPGVGPIGVARHLVPFLPTHDVVDMGGKHQLGAVSAAPWGSAGILAISWAYIAMLGASGLKKATQIAMLNANYIAEQLHPYFPVLYRGQNDRVAHECIIDLRPLKEETGIDVEDVAKRLMDYGYHAPTMSFPVPGTLMIEPTESESLEELDRFCQAMICIHAEMIAVRDGTADKENNVLVNAPHTAVAVSADEWPHTYSRSQAAYPVASLREHKFWPAVGRIDNVWGDRNLFCTCS